MYGNKLSWVPSNFLALPEEQSRLSDATVVVMPVPYDGTTSFKGGARNGPSAIISASYALEDYDIELGVDVSTLGIHTSQAVEPHMGGPEYMVERIRESVASFVHSGKFVAILGGEHTVGIGHVQALKVIYPDLSIVYLDAHADLRDEYMGTKWGHASVARRMAEICPVVQIGVRSLSAEENYFIEQGGVTTFFWGSHYKGYSNYKAGDIGNIVEHLSRNVYVSLDLDVMDPSVIPEVGTPEPGGMSWEDVTCLLRSVAEKCNIVGCDVSELSPETDMSSSSYIAAKLVYKLIAYSKLLSGFIRDYN